MEVSTDGDAIGGRSALVFTSTTGPGLKNVSLLMPGWPAGTDPDTLNPQALATMAGNCVVTRFLGYYFYGHTQWDGVTPPTPCDWSIRPRLGDATYVLGGWGVYGLGAPFEIIAKIVNAIGSDVWLNIPSTVDEAKRDEYVTNVVTLFDSLLPAGRRIYLEFANECMFGNNQCYQDCTTLANVSVFQRGDPYRLNFGLPSPPNMSNLISHFNPRMYAWHALHFAGLAAAVVGAARVGRADVPGVRVVPVLGANGGYAPDGEGKLAWLQAAYGPPAAAGLATMNIGAYVGAARNVTGNPNATTDMIISSMLDAVARQSTAAPTAYTSALAGFAVVSAYYGVALHAYEGGPDTSGYKDAGLMAAAEACRDARMTDVVTGIVGAWQSWTSGTFNYFTLGAQPLLQPWGSYTTQWDLKITDTPKARGIAKIVSSPPAPLSAGWPVPVLNHSASFFVGYYSPDSLPPSNPVVSYLPLNSTLNYLVRAKACAALGVNVTVYMSGEKKGAGGDPLEVSIGVFLPPVVILGPPADGTRRDWTAVTALFPPLPAGALASGLIAVRLRVAASGVNYILRSLDITCR